jgi:hypothetical protein
MTNAGKRRALVSPEPPSASWALLDYIPVHDESFWRSSSRRRPNQRQWPNLDNLTGKLDNLLIMRCFLIARTGTHATTIVYIEPPNGP